VVACGALAGCAHTPDLPLRPDPAPPDDSTTEVFTARDGTQLLARHWAPKPRIEAPNPPTAGPTMEAGGPAPTAGPTMEAGGPAPTAGIDERQEPIEIVDVVVPVVGRHARAGRATVAARVERVDAVAWLCGL